MAHFHFKRYFRHVTDAERLIELRFDTTRPAIDPAEAIAGLTAFLRQLSVSPDLSSARVSSNNSKRKPASWRTSTGRCMLARPLHARLLDMIIRRDSYNLFHALIAELDRAAEAACGKPARGRGANSNSWPACTVRRLRAWP